jgi:hypothetical protein
MREGVALAKAFVHIENHATSPSRCSLRERARPLGRASNPIPASAGRNAGSRFEPRRAATGNETSRATWASWRRASTRPARRARRLLARRTDDHRPGGCAGCREAASRANSSKR